MSIILKAYFSVLAIFFFATYNALREYFRTMEMSIVAGFWVVSFLLIMTPGADWAYAISAGINGRRVVPAVMGLMSGHLLATLIVVAGVGVLIAQHPLALTGLTVAGALYLLWLGITLLRHPAVPEKAIQHADNWTQWAVKGLCISGLNPKVFAVHGPASAVYRPNRKLVDSDADVRAWDDALYHLYHWSICWWGMVRKRCWRPGHRRPVW